MGRSSTVYIQLTNPYRSYFAGQQVEGKVIIQNDKPLKIKRVAVLLEGKARVRWTEQEPYTVYSTETINGRRQTTPKTRYRTVSYTAEEIYISQKIHLDGDGSNLMVLKEGTVAYPFRFILPVTLPSSFTCRVGLVSYFVEAELKRPILKPNMRTTLPFTVNGIFDLNLEPAASQCLENRRVKGSNYFACRKGQLGFVFRLPHRCGFVPGEILDFHVEISNGSNKKVTEITATLKQLVTCYAQGKHKKSVKVINYVQGEEIEQGEHEMWSPGTLLIPALPPTRLGGTCRIIDVQYSLQFEMNISGLSSSLRGNLPVFIGTIPFRSNFVDFGNTPASIPAIPISTNPPQPQPRMGFNSPADTKMSSTEAGPSSSITVPDIANAPSAPFLADYPDLPPPSYAEAVGAEGFDFTQASNNSNDQGQDNNQPGSSQWKESEYINANSPSAPSIDSFVPNYITYNKL